MAAKPEQQNGAYQYYTSNKMNLKLKFLKSPAAGGLWQ